MDGDAGAGAEYNPRMRATTADLARAVLIAALSLPLGACSLPYVPPFTSPPPAAVAHPADSAGRVVGPPRGLECYRALVVGDVDGAVGSAGLVAAGSPESSHNQ